MEYERVDQKLMKEVAETRLLSKKADEEVVKIATARCLRADLSEQQAKDTVRAAFEMVDRISDPTEKNEIIIQTSKPPWGMPAQPSVLGKMVYLLPMASGALYMMAPGSVPWRVVGSSAHAETLLKSITQKGCTPQQLARFIEWLQNRMGDCLEQTSWAGRLLMAPSWQPVPPTQ
jgi:hypothetical protein